MKPDIAGWGDQGHLGQWGLGQQEDGRSQFVDNGHVRLGSFVIMAGAVERKPLAPVDPQSDARVLALTDGLICTLRTISLPSNSLSLVLVVVLDVVLPVPSGRVAGHIRQADSEGEGKSRQSHVGPYCTRAR